MISVVISYCSLENQFIDRVIEECCYFSDDIIVVKGTHLLTGERDANAKTFENEDFLRTITIEIDRETLKKNGSRYYHNAYRFAGWKEAKNDYVLFLDADELPNGPKFLKFLREFKYENFNGMSFDAYWYFRDTTNQALTTEETTALFRKDALKQEDFFGPMERWTMFNMPRCVRRFDIPWEDGPVFHHYSWVRTKEDMLKKVAGWGHVGDKDWTKLVKAEFEHDFNGTDFVHGYSYRKVESYL